MIPTTRIVIEHHPRFQRITVTSPDDEVLFRVDASPSVALRALAAFVSHWSER